MKNKKNSSQSFELPAAILSQLNEFSNGGFLLIRMGANNGPPEVYLQADNPIISMGLVDFGRIWSKSVCRANENIIMGNMLDHIDGEEEDEDEDEE